VCCQFSSDMTFGDNSSVTINDNIKYGGAQFFSNMTFNNNTSAITEHGRAMFREILKQYSSYI